MASIYKWFLAGTAALLFTYGVANYTYNRIPGGWQATSSKGNVTSVTANNGIKIHNKNKATGIESIVEYDQGVYKASGFNPKHNGIWSVWDSNIRKGEIGMNTPNTTNTAYIEPDKSYSGFFRYFSKLDGSWNQSSPRYWTILR